MKKSFIRDEKLGKVLEKYPYLEDYLMNNMIDVDPGKSLSEIIEDCHNNHPEDMTVQRDEFFRDLEDFIKQMNEILGLQNEGIGELTILPGVDKSGNGEKFEKIVIKKGEIVSIVGPTGSGKSRLLADIEWGAQKDTPTGRQILVDGKPLDRKRRFSIENKLVAQLSQNMNFVMDLSVKEFLELHAESRMVDNKNEIVEKIFTRANELAGEKFSLSSQITGLSGGQSRALMIADTAILSRSPIVLIDEIENAGIDRKKALELLTGEEKIVLMATHDPLLALMGDRRIVIKNGGIDKVMEVTDEEREILSDLMKVDGILQTMRNRLRYGEKLELDLIKELNLY